MDNLALVLLCVGLAYLGFEYNSGKAFFGSLVAFLRVSG